MSASTWVLKQTPAGETTVEEFAISVSWRDAYVTVAIRTPENEMIERRGRLVVDRVLREGPGEKVTDRVVGATVSSLLGDVVGKDRTIRGACEDYGSKVARALLDQRRRTARASAR